MTCTCSQPVTRKSRSGQCFRCAARQNVAAQRERALAKRQERIEDVEWMLATGETPLGIARRLRVKPHTLERSLDRAGRRDLAQAVHVAEPGSTCECGRPKYRKAEQCAKCVQAARRFTTRTASAA